MPDHWTRYHERDHELRTVRGPDRKRRRSPRDRVGSPERKPDRQLHKGKELIYHKSEVQEGGRPSEGTKGCETGEWVET